LAVAVVEEVMVVVQVVEVQVIQEVVVL